MDTNLGEGGIYNPLNLGLYTYTHQNPVRLTDPDGNAPYNPWNPREAFNPHNLNDAGPRGPDAGYGPGMRANGMPDRGRSYDNRSLKQIQADDIRVYEARQKSQQLKTNNEGRQGKQQRLREVARDDKASSADRGWVKQEMNSIERGQRKNIRNPPGKDLAHERGREAAKGYGYEHSNLQDRDLHRLQHKYDNFGKKNAERPPE